MHTPESRREIYKLADERGETAYKEAKELVTHLEVGSNLIDLLPLNAREAARAEVLKQFGLTDEANELINPQK